MNPKIAQLLSFKKRAEKIAVLTAYDYPTARLLDESGVDLLLVGDSLGMVLLGYPDTTSVTMAEMIHHTGAVARGGRRAPIVADLPFASYESHAQAVANAAQLIAAGADAVKLEGGASHVPQIEALVAADIAVMAHIGMMPQSVRKEGGYRIKGKTPADADRLLSDAIAVEKAGAFAVVLELIVPEVARMISERIDIPTIGIGAGNHCDGQVLVTHDLIGFFPWFTPKFVHQRAKVGEQIQAAAAAFVNEVKTSK